MRFLSFAILLCASVCAAQPEVPASLDRAVKTSLDRAIEAKIAAFPGKVSLYAKNLDSGATYAIRSDDPVRTASTIKLAIMVECFAEAAEGKLNWMEPLKITDADRVSGTGVAQDFTDGDQLPIRDLLDLMIVLSDNTATNIILDRIGGNAVNQRMATLGFDQTRVMRKIRGDGTNLKAASGFTEEGSKPENAKWGIGRTTPHEMVTILEKLYRGELINKATSDGMLAVLKRQRDHDCIGRDMQDVTIASKSGSLDHLRSDVGIVYSKRGPIAMAITVDDIPEINYTPDNPGDLLISALSEILVRGLGSNH